MSKTILSLGVGKVKKIILDRDHKIFLSIRLWVILNPSAKFHENRSTLSNLVNIQTGRQTNKPTKVSGIERVDTVLLDLMRRYVVHAERALHYVTV